MHQNYGNFCKGLFRYIDYIQPHGILQHNMAYCCQLFYETYYFQHHPQEAYGCTFLCPFLSWTWTWTWHLQLPSFSSCPSGGTCCMPLTRQGSYELCLCIYPEKTKNTIITFCYVFPWQWSMVY